MSTRKIAEKLVLAWTLDALEKRPDLCFVTRMNTGAIRLEKRFIRFGCVGWADIIGMTTRGRFLAVEAKSSTGKLSDAQALFKSKVEACGGLYFMVASSGDVLDMIKTLEAK